MSESPAVVKEKVLSGRAWIEAACETLIGLRLEGTGWGYEAGKLPAAEPTALVALGLLAAASGAGSSAVAGLSEARGAAAWLMGLQQPDGSLGVSAELTQPCWPTPYALLLWGALGAFPAHRQAAVRWLLGERGTTLAKPKDGVIGHDPALVGWPWVPHTHSWLEPTAMAILALRREGLGRHARAREGLRLIRDRAVAGGGWNYGNSAVFGTALRPQPGPTGQALLALAGTGGPPEKVEPALCYLRAALPGIRSGQSLGWGLLGLKAWHAWPEHAECWLAEAASKATERKSAPGLGLLLLAACPRSLDLMGVPVGAIGEAR